MIITKKPWIAPVFIFLLSLTLLASFAAQTVQTGDTGWLVLSAKNLSLAHPPGYPLFIWVYYLGIKALGAFGLNSFFAASLWSALLSSLTITLLFTLAQSISMLFGICLCLALLAQTHFLQYLVLPDVFALHCLLVCAILWCYSRIYNLHKRILVLSILFAFGISHHHSIIFLAPIWIYAFYPMRHHLPAYLQSIAILVLIPTIFYGSLYLLSSSTNYAWSFEQGFWHYFFRKDYGSFQLMAGSKDNYLLDNLWLFTKLSAWPFLIATFACILYLKRNIFRPLLQPLWLSAVLTIFVFFLLANIAPVGFSFSIIKRFYLMPTIILAVLLCLLLWDLHTHKHIRWLRLVICLVLILPASQGPTKSIASSNFATNKIIEDYARNILSQKLPHNTIILPSSDTEYSALHFVQQEYAIGKNYTIVMPNLLFYSWYRKRKLQQLPLLKLPNSIIKSNELDLKQWVQDNLNNYSFLITKPWGPSPNYKLEVLPVGRLLSNGQGLAFSPWQRDNLNLRNSYDDFTIGTRFNEFAYFYAQYAYYFLNMAAIAKAQNNEKLYRLALQRSLALVPYCLPAQKRLCELFQDQQKPLCFQRVKDISQQIYPYF